MTQQSKKNSQLRIVQADNHLVRLDTPPSGMTKLGEMMTPPALAGSPPSEVCWTCEICGPIEPLYLPFGSGRWVKRHCECQRREQREHEREEIRQTWLREQRTRTFGGWMGAKWVDDEIVQEMCSRTFDGYDVLRQPEGFEKAFAFAQQLKGNLLFYGDYGTGKTHLEAAICNYVREVGKLLPDGKRQPVTSIFVTAPQFFMVYEQTKKAFDQTNHIRLIEQVLSTPLLVFDDIDKSRPTETRWEVYWEIFDERCKAKRPTIVSTNKREELDHYIGAASLSRLSRGLVAVQMVGDDYRREE